MEEIKYSITDQFKSLLKAFIPSREYNLWFSKITIELKDKVIMIHTPNNFTKMRINSYNHYLNKIGKYLGCLYIKIL